MKNIEGIRITEIPEKAIEVKSINIKNFGNDNFDDCILNDEDKKKKMQKELDTMLFDDCEKNKTTVYVEDYEDCRKK